MSTFTKLTYHIVFSTKYPHKLIYSPFRERLYEYMGGIIRAQNGHLIEIGGIEDHVHVLAHLLDYCQYLLSSQINYTITNFADHTEKFSHDAINRYLKNEKIRRLNYGKR